MTANTVSQRDDARQIFAGRIDVLYALGRHYLSLPFAVLCVPATVLAGNRLGYLPVTPLLLADGGGDRRGAIDRRLSQPPGGKRSAFLGAALHLRLGHRGRDLGAGLDILVRLGLLPGARPISRSPIWG